MSGAEFLVVLGVASSVIQVVDSCNRVIDRLREFRENLQFQDISIQLALLVNDVQRLKSQEPELSLDRATEQALERVLQGYLRQLNALEELLKSMTPAETASKFRRTLKGLRSFGKDTKLQRIMGILAEYKTTLNLHLSSRLTITPPSEKIEAEVVRSYFEVPNKQVSHFVGRTNLLGKIRGSLTTSKANPAITVLTGIGGQGKTQCALKFCQEARPDYRGIFWIDGSSQISATRSFETIAEKLSSGKELLDTESKISFVKDTLQSWSEPWLLVFDNYDNPRLFNNISSFFPVSKNTCKNGILITSRHVSTERLGNAIKVHGLSEDESLELLFHGSDVGTFDEKTLVEGKKIVKQLGYLALAIDQAAAYISIRQLPLEMFADHFTQRKEVILKHTPETLWEYQTTNDKQDGELSNLSVFTTWEMSFEQIGEDDNKRHQTGQFLTCCAFLDSSNISEELFQGYAQHGDFAEAPVWLNLFMTNGEWDTYSFQDVMVGLMSLNLIQSIQTTSNGMRFSLHPLIKDWLQLRESKSRSRSSKGLEKASVDEVKETRSQNTIQAVKITADFIHVRNINALTFSTRQEILGHIDTCLENVQQFMGSGKQKLQDPNYSAFLQDYATTFATFLGLHDRFISAEELFLKALTWQTSRGDTWNVTSLRTANNLGIMYLDMEKPEEAKNMLKAAFEGKERLLGKDDALTLNTVNNLGNLYSTYSMLNEASTMYSTALQGFLKIRDPSHHSVRETRNNLGEVLMKQGRYQEAEAMFQVALMGQHYAAKDANALTLYIQSNLAIVYKAQGKVDKAITTYKQVITGREALLGPDHSSTIASKREMADVYYELGQHKLAEQIYPGFKLSRLHKPTAFQSRPYGATCRNCGPICNEHPIRCGGFDPPEKPKSSIMHKTVEPEEITYFADWKPFSLDGQEPYVDGASARRDGAMGIYNPIARVSNGQRIGTGNSLSNLQADRWDEKRNSWQHLNRHGSHIIASSDEAKFPNRGGELGDTKPFTPAPLSSSSTLVENTGGSTNYWERLSHGDNLFSGPEDFNANNTGVASEGYSENGHMSATISSKLDVLDLLVDMQKTNEKTELESIDRSGAAIRNQMCAIKSLVRMKRQLQKKQGLEDQVSEVEIDLQARLRELEERLEEKQTQIQDNPSSNLGVTITSERDANMDGPSSTTLVIPERHGPSIADRHGPSIIDENSGSEAVMKIERYGRSLPNRKAQGAFRRRIRSHKATEEEKAKFRKQATLNEKAQVELEQHIALLQKVDLLEDQASVPFEYASVHGKTQFKKLGTPQCLENKSLEKMEEIQLRGRRHRSQPESELPFRNGLTIMNDISWDVTNSPMNDSCPYRSRSSGLMPRGEKSNQTKIDIKWSYIHDASSPSRSGCRMANSCYTSASSMTHQEFHRHFSEAGSNPSSLDHQQSSEDVVNISSQTTVTEHTGSTGINNYPPMATVVGGSGSYSNSLQNNKFEAFDRSGVSLQNQLETRVGPNIDLTSALHKLRSYEARSSCDSSSSPETPQTSVVEPPVFRKASHRAGWPATNGSRVSLKSLAESTSIARDTFPHLSEALASQTDVKMNAKIPLPSHTYPTTTPPRPAASPPLPPPPPPVGTREAAASAVTLFEETKMTVKSRMPDRWGSNMSNPFHRILKTPSTDPAPQLSTASTTQPPPPPLSHS
ncbi:MAG: hypothetical protein MMC33_006248 [Icmadophila ericetorum]|nr:hypothetical protein [Icmadophila ericetorum]